eukprot:TRINITY_DN875_c0_g1_i1.p1 TRINITY_DN875_c0_g1~~TRINITY_DN875_c0_g1_i1.p1  ORF type:complete len:432 (-),score=79.44 TRINITY_DN875_c0_g1_i1:126-1274(-)
MSQLGQENVKERDIVIHMDNVHKTYLLGIEGVPALRGVTLSIRRGDWAIIYGTSGGGKTTMLNIIGTIDKPTKGQLFLFGNRITSKTKDAQLANIRSKKMGFVFQTFNLLGSMTALENVEMPMILAGGTTAAERRARAVSLLQRVGMGHRLHHLPTQLSGGEQQRVTIARAVANKPELLLLDEPTGDLDSANTHIVCKLLKDLNEQEGITLVMVTHDPALKNFAHKVVRMRDGKLASVEDVDVELRKERENQLFMDLAELKQAVPWVQTDGGSGTNTSTDDTASAATAPPVNFNSTEIRQPTDYGYFNFRALNGLVAPGTVHASALFATNPLPPMPRRMDSRSTSQMLVQPPVAASPQLIDEKPSDDEEAPLGTATPARTSL